MELREAMDTVWGRLYSGLLGRQVRLDEVADALSQVLDCVLVCTSPDNAEEENEEIFRLATLLEAGNRVGGGYS